ncbi:hypothetical protein [Scytonema sp. NUACC26]|uniref:hypothetical protein n=1 Tax=Scytonema sp. NUACC26 TaxID=3140176 RepID=UPI0038B3A570
MIQTPTVRQILSDPDAGLLPYLRHLLQSEEFSKFKAQLSFHVDESSTSVNKSDDSREMHCTVSITLKLLIVVASQTLPDDATLHALEFQEVFDAELINWSQRSKQLLKPISEIKGTLSNFEEIPYQGGYLPGFELQRKFTLTYSTVQAQTKQESAKNGQEFT